MACCVVANTTEVSIFRKMSAAEAEKTFETMRLQPQIKGTDSSKYLSESLEKVQAFQNKAVAAGTDQQIVEFVLDRQGYNKLMSTAVEQSSSKGVDAIKFHYEGMSQTANPSLRNIGVPASKLDEFNQLIIDIKRANGG